MLSVNRALIAGVVVMTGLIALSGNAAADESGSTDILVPLVATTLFAAQGGDAEFVHYRNHRHRHRGYRHRPYYQRDYYGGRYGRDRYGRYRVYRYYDGYRYRYYRQYFRRY